MISTDHLTHVVIVEVSLPTVNVYNVEFAELPTEWGGLASPAPLPASIPMDKIMSNIEPQLKLRHLTVSTAVFATGILRH